MQKHCLVHLVAAAIIGLLFVGFAWGGDVPREIASQYRPAVEKLREAYTHATVEGSSSVAYPIKEKLCTQEFVMCAAGKKRRLDLKTTGQKGMGLKVGATQMRMATPDGALITTMDPNSKFFDDATEKDYADTVSQIDNRSLLHFPYALDSNGTILDMLQNPGVKVTGVKTIKGQGKSVVQIDYEDTRAMRDARGCGSRSLCFRPATAGHCKVLRGRLTRARCKSPSAPS